MNNAPLTSLFYFSFSEGTTHNIVAKIHTSPRELPSCIVSTILCNCTVCRVPCGIFYCNLDFCEDAYKWEQNLRHRFRRRISSLTSEFCSQKRPYPAGKHKGLYHRAALHSQAGMLDWVPQSLEETPGTRQYDTPDDACRSPDIIC